MKKVLITGGCSRVGSRIALGLLSDFEVDIIDDLSTGSLDNFSSKSEFRVCPSGMFSNFPDDAREDMVLIFTGDYACEEIIDRVRSGYYDLVIHLANNSDLESNSKNLVACFENNVYKAVALLVSCANSSTRLILNQSFSQDSNNLFDTHCEFVEKYAIELARRRELKYSTVKSPNVHFVEQLREDFYIENIVYSNISLAKANYPGKEIQIK